jgi:hypothetical protein
MAKYDSFTDFQYCIAEIYRLMAFTGIEDTHDPNTVSLEELLNSSALYFDMNNEPMQSMTTVGQRQALRKKYRWNQSARKFIYQRNLIKARMAENG